MTTEPISRPLVVLIHGYLDDPTAWRHIAPRLEAEGFRTIAPTLARHEAELTLDAFAETVTAATSAALAEEGLDGVVLVGQSMGAQVAELAARNIDDVRALVLLTPIPLGGLALPEEMTGPLRGCAGNAEIQRALRSQLSAALSADDLEHLVRTGLDLPGDRVEGWFDAWVGGDPDAAEDAPPAVPTMVLAGAADPFVNKDLLGLIEARFPDALLHTIPGVGHWPHVEAPDAVATELVSFLRGALAADGQHGDGDVTEEAWTGAFEQKRDDSFAATLAEDVTLHASVLHQPVTGRDDVAFVMGEASQIYEKLDFVHQAQSGPITFLEWHAQTFSGVSLQGVTLLERDDDGLIARVAIHHRPLGGALAFSAELRERTMARIGDDYLWNGTPRE